MIRHAAIAGLLAVFASAGLVAQDAAKLPAFEVASIKPTASLDRGGGRSGWEPGGRYQAVNVPGVMLVRFAYGTPQRALLPYRVEGVPPWLSSARYDIVGKVRSDLAPTERSELGAKGPMFLRSLLEERFRLRVHHESRQLQVYRLVRARRDGSLGPRLRRSTCTSVPAFCKLEYLTGHLIFEGVPIGKFADDLSGSLDRVIVDDTGLTGPFDVDLEWSPDQSASDKPSIFTALQEQLGLKLESTKGPVEVLVIDHVERPTED